MMNVLCGDWFEVVMSRNVDLCRSDTEVGVTFGILSLLILLQSCSTTKEPA